MEIFTDAEKQILEGTNKNYKWIARDENGELCIYKRKPFKENGEYFATLGNLDVFNKCVSDVLYYFTPHSSYEKALQGASMFYLNKFTFSLIKHLVVLI